MYLCIDFGTCFTKMGYSDNGNIINLIAAGKVPTVAAYHSLQNKLYFGHIAQRIDSEHVETANFFKLELKRNLDFKLGPYTLAEILQLYFLFLSQEFVETSGINFDQIAVAIPNYFGLQARKLLTTSIIEAFEISNITLIPEPGAAFWGYADSLTAAIDGDFLVADLGGGTSDFNFITAIADSEAIIIENGLQVGSDVFSGSEVDRSIIKNVFYPAFQHQCERPLPAALLREDFTNHAEQYHFNQWLLWAEELKITLGNQAVFFADWPNFYFGNSMSLSINSSFLISNLHEIFERLSKYISEVLKPKAKQLGTISQKDKTKLLLFGGCSKLIGVNDLFAQHFPDFEILAPDEPDFCVLKGLVKITEKAGHTYLSIKNIYPFHFFIECVPVNSDSADHYLEKIPFDTDNLELSFNLRYHIATIPTESKFNVSSDQDSFAMRIYEIPIDQTNPLLENYIGRSLVLNLETDRHSLPDSIDVFINFFDSRLELNNKSCEVNLSMTHENLKDIRCKPKEVFDLISNYSFLDERLMKDYQNHIAKILPEDEESLEEFIRSSFYKTLALLQFWPQKK